MRHDEATLILPTQLFEQHKLITKERWVILLESPRYFSAHNFHKQKILLHRATMQMYNNFLKDKGLDVIYIEHHNAHTLIKECTTRKITLLNCYDPVDIPYQNELENLLGTSGITLQIHETPLFLSSTSWLKTLFKNKKRAHMQSFYIAQRKRMNILINKHGKPTGGAWNFDAQNRKRLPEHISIPKLYQVPINEYIKEATRYVQTHFDQNPGDINTIYYPTTFVCAKKWFNDFLQHRLALFGAYEDAIHTDDPFLFHSVLSPLLNIGLLTPHYVIEQAMTHYKKSQHVPLASIEGFIRQIIGWREYVRAMYIFEYASLRSTNFFNHTHKLPQNFWNGTTGIDPIDSAITCAIKTAYCHHIIRLMILGNFMLLCNIDPREVYNWFMQFFIDAYDWVMVPNVYGMSQYASENLMTTKPYISGSNYILKMSNFKKGAWCAIWDALYWYFIVKKQPLLSQNARMKTAYMLLKRMNNERLHKHITHAEAFLKDMQK